MITLFTFFGILAISNAGYIGLGSGVGSSSGGASLLGGHGFSGGIEVSGTGGDLSSGSEGLSLGIDHGGAFRNTGYSFAAVSGDTHVGVGIGGGLGGGGGGAGTSIGVATIPSGHAVAYPTAFSSQSRFDVIHPGTILRQTVVHVPAVSIHSRPVAVAVGHGHGHSYSGA